ncbi:obscurin like 1, partial [Chelydra serpentina]
RPHCQGGCLFFPPEGLIPLPGHSVTPSLPRRPLSRRKGGAALSPGGSGTWSASPASGSISPGACPVGWCLGPAAVLVRGPAVPQPSPEMDVFGGAPRFLAYPRTFTVQSGADAILTCQIAGDPCPSIIWEKDKSPVALLGRCRVEAEGNVYSLSISQVTPADSGQYICKAKNAVGETYAAATLKVEAGELQQEGDPEDVPPGFLSKPLSWQVCRGEDVVFTCRVSGQPCPVLQWEKDGRQLSDLFESSHFCVGKEPDDWHFLKVYSARPPDGGVYVCRARNRSGEALAAAVLLVDPMARGQPDGPFLGSPRNCRPLSRVSKQPDQQGDRRHCHGQRSTPWPARPNGEVAPSAPKAKAFAVSEGKHAKFRCYVTGKPKPEIVWKKDGKVVAPDRRHLVYEDREGYFILKVLFCKARDQGLYVCTASNTAGQTLSAVQLHVREPRVRFQVQLEDVEVQECEDAVLECKVPLETIPTAWYLEDKQLQPSHKYVIEEQGPVRRLTIRDARTDDDGIYLCEMKDKGRSIAEVSVRGAIVKRLPRKLDVMEGENAAFCVETRDAVEGIRWTRNGLELRETPCTVLKSFGKTHLLVLVHVTREDAGVISFSVGESQTSAQQLRPGAAGGQHGRVGAVPYHGPGQHGGGARGQRAHRGRLLLPHLCRQQVREEPARGIPWLCAPRPCSLRAESPEGCAGAGGPGCPVLPGALGLRGGELVPERGEAGGGRGGGRPALLHKAQRDRALPAAPRCAAGGERGRGHVCVQWRAGLCHSAGASPTGAHRPGARGPAPPGAPGRAAPAPGVRGVHARRPRALAQGRGGCNLGRRGRPAGRGLRQEAVYPLCPPLGRRD